MFSHLLSPPTACDGITGLGVELAEGVCEGVTAGVCDGVTEGVCDGVTEGVCDGATEGVCDGVPGVADGNVDGGVPGAVEVWAKATPAMARRAAVQNVFSMAVPFNGYG